MAPKVTIMETTFDVYPQGDVILACGSEYGDGSITNLRVSAAVLSLGSPVFKAMFKPHFKEGTDLLDQLPGVPLLIKLPEDDPMAMDIICNILHLRNDRVSNPEKWQPNKILRVARAADKYNCIVALQHTARLWLQTPFDWIAAGGTEKTHQLFLAAYLFRDKGNFKKWGKRLMLYSRESVCDTAVAGEKDALGEILNALEQKKSNARRNVINFVENQIVMRSQMRTTNTTFSCKSECAWAERVTAAHVADLCKQKLYPTNEVQNASLHELICRLDSISFSPPSNMTQRCCKTCISEQKVVERYNHEPYRTAHVTAGKDLFGPCLECYLQESKVVISTCKHDKAGGYFK